MLWFYGLLAIFIILNLIYEYTIGENFTDRIPKIIAYTFVPYFYLFLTGVLLQRLNLYKSSLFYNKGIFWIVAYVLFCLLLPDHINPAVNLFKNIFLGFCILSIAYTRPNTSEKLLRTNDISYGIYIYHGLLLTVLVQLKATHFENLFFLIGVSYILGYLSWILIEKPFIRRKEKTIRKVE